MNCSRTSKRNPIKALLASLIICLLATGLLIYESNYQVRLALYGVKTHATVIDVKQSGRNRIVTFQFTNESGAIINVREIRGARRPEVGDVLPIVYLPANPEVVSVQGISGCTFIFISLILAVLGGLSFVSTLWGRDMLKNCETIHQ